MDPIKKNINYRQQNHHNERFGGHNFFIDTVSANLGNVNLSNPFFEQVPHTRSMLNGGNCFTI
jgi:hypothetical protein